METVDLRSDTFAITKYISKELEGYFANVEEPIVRHELDHMLIAIKTRIFGEQLEYKEIKYPCDWWQALRERWFPVEWLERHPVVYTTVVFDARFLYPSLKSNEPQFRAVKHVSLKIDGMEVDARGM